MLNLEGTLFCGQTFAWKKIGLTYQAVLEGRLVTLTDDSFYDSIHQDPVLYHYFDMDWDYSGAESYLSTLDPHLAIYIQNHKSLHILNQDPWEVMVSFLLSQNNNIKRIRSLYERLCQHYGSLIEPMWYSFPRPHQMKSATDAQLRSLGLGFRSVYLLDALQNHHVLDLVAEQDLMTAKQTLMSIRGIGEKVASCILLFAFHQMRSFPVDTWIKKVMKQYYPNLDGTYFAPYEALAQQYLFHGIRSDGGTS
jgi:N-glycosylase/DNA lyase